MPVISLVVDESREIVPPYQGIAIASSISPLIFQLGTRIFNMICFSQPFFISEDKQHPN